MEDEKLKELLGSFKPELSSDDLFMARLQGRMEAVEIVRRHSAEVRKRNRIAVVVAALSGFVMGVVMTLLFPLIGDWVSTVDISLPYITEDSFQVNIRMLVWALTAGVSGITAYNAYIITLSGLSARRAI